MTLFLTFLLVSYAAYSFATAETSVNPVCIVGAGPSGLTIAHELETKGYKTVVFDKQPEVGGKCQGFYDRPDP